MTSIKVVARFRPQNRIENEQGGLPVVNFEGNDTCAISVGFLQEEGEEDDDNEGEENEEQIY